MNGRKSWLTQRTQAQNLIFGAGSRSLTAIALILAAMMKSFSVRPPASPISAFKYHYQKDTSALNDDSLPQSLPNCSSHDRLRIHGFSLPNTLGSGSLCLHSLKEGGPLTGCACNGDGFEIACVCAVWVKGWPKECELISMAALL